MEFHLKDTLLEYYITEFYYNKARNEEKELELKL